MVTYKSPSGLRKFDSRLHPRDSKGRFIRVNEIIEFFDQYGVKNIATVDELLPNNRLRVHTTSEKSMVVNATSVTVPPGVSSGTKLGKVRERLSALRAKLPASIGDIGTTIPTEAQIEDIVSLDSNVAYYRKYVRDNERYLAAFQEWADLPKRPDYAELPRFIQVRAAADKLGEDSDIYRSLLFALSYYADSTGYPEAKEEAEAFKYRCIASTAPGATTYAAIAMYREVLQSRVRNNDDAEFSSKHIEQLNRVEELLRRARATDDPAYTTIALDARTVSLETVAVLSTYSLTGPSHYLPDSKEFQADHRAVEFQRLPLIEQYTSIAQRYEKELRDRLASGMPDIDPKDHGPGARTVKQLDIVSAMGREVDAQVDDLMLQRGFPADSDPTRQFGLHRANDLALTAFRLHESQEAADELFLDESALWLQNLIGFRPFKAGSDSLLSDMMKWIEAFDERTYGYYPFESDMAKKKAHDALVTEFGSIDGARQWVAGLRHEKYPPDVYSAMQKIQDAVDAERKEIQSFSTRYKAARREAYREVLQSLGVSFGSPKDMEWPYFKVSVPDAEQMKSIDLGTPTVVVSTIGDHRRKQRVTRDVETGDYVLEFLDGKEEPRRFNATDYSRLGVKLLLPIPDGTRKALEEAFEWMPTEWVRGVWQHSEGVIPVSPIVRASRGEWGLNMPTEYSTSNVSTAMHEEHHGVEFAFPWIRSLEHAILVRSVYEGEIGERKPRKGKKDDVNRYKIRKLQAIYPNSGYRRYEEAFSDDFGSAYMGKVYGSHDWSPTSAGGHGAGRENYELVTMTAEQVLGPYRSEYSLQDSYNETSRALRHSYLGMIVASASSDLALSPGPEGVDVPATMSPVLDTSRLPASIKSLVATVRETDPSGGVSVSLTQLGDTITIEATNPRNAVRYRVSYRLAKGRTPKIVKSVRVDSQGTESPAPTTTAGLTKEMTQWASVGLSV